MKFAASLDKTAKVITIGIGILFAFLIALPFLGKESDTAEIYIPGGLLAIYTLAFLFSPQRYSVTESLLIIHRPIRNIYLRRRDIEEVGVLEKANVNGAMRTFGVGGLFGYFGKFYNYGIGSATWYMTRTDKAVLVRMKNKKVVLSPDVPDAFIAALQAN